MKTGDRCPAVSVSSGYSVTRRYRCQREVGHAGTCTYHRKGGQGGTLLRWWGVNPQPHGDLTNASYPDLLREVHRLRALLDHACIAW